MKKFFSFFWGIVRSYGESFVEAIGENEYTQEFKERYPRVFRFVKNRLSPREYLGLHLTIGFFIALYLTNQCIELITSIVRNTELAQIDVNIITFLTATRTGVLMKPMFFFTALGNWPTIALFFLFFATLWIWQKRWFRVWMLFLTMAGSEAIAILMKIFIARPRPDSAGALLLETTYSFPSGHALIALSFYGFLTYIWLRERRHIVTRIVIFLFAAFTIVGVGVSRIYLGVHWPSDVLGGYLLALIWLTVIATAADLRKRFVRERHYPTETLFPFRWIAPLLIVFGSAVLVYVVAFVARPHFEPSALHRHIDITGTESATSLDAAMLDNLPNISEGLTGRSLEPVNLIFIGNAEEVDSAMTKAGWFLAEQVTLKSSWDIFLRVLRNRSYPTAPVSPAFLYDRPQDSAWQKPTEKNSPRERHHIRLWRDERYTIDGKALWVGTASFDAGIRLTATIRIPTHRIAPAIDVERDLVVSDLRRVGAIQKEESVQRYDPFLGVNAIGDQFFTDGKAVILSL
ncbi:MAG: LssY C-terminal domain-containing protein [bacterium]|nr:LssY C-terminal domain-containing protein [bacterium]MDO8581585.1 LssY C-terminal domain-containing protein [bacterium]